MSFADADERQYFADSEDRLTDDRQTDDCFVREIILNLLIAIATLTTESLNACSGWGMCSTEL